jgi:hypothetical protein
MKARGFGNVFMNFAFGTLDVNGRLRGWRLGQFSPQVRARLRIHKIPEQEQIEMSCEDCF